MDIGRFKVSGLNSHVRRIEMFIPSKDVQRDLSSPVNFRLTGSVILFRMRPG